MNKYNKITIISFIITCLSLLLYSYAFAQDTTIDKINIYTTWDDERIYIACEAQTPNVNGIHSDYNKPIGNDDGIEILFNLSADNNSKTNDKTSYLAISVARGFEFKRGNNEGNLIQKNIFSHRYGVKINGSVNNNSDIDSGYSIETAIQWKDLGIESPGYTTIGLNVKIRVNGKDYYLNPITKTNEDFLSPNKCLSAVLSRLSTFNITGSNKIISSRYLTEPTINGEIKPGEWNKKTATTIEIPITGENPYKIKFQNQMVYIKELTIPEGAKGIIDDPNRVDVIKSYIENLAISKESKTDAIAISNTKYLPQTIDALNEIRTETNSYIAVCPIIDKYKDPEDLYNQIERFYQNIPYQYRLSISDDEGIHSYLVYTDIDHNTYTTEIADKFLKNHNVSLIIKDISDLKTNNLEKRPYTEYSYIITNYSFPKEMTSQSLIQSTFFIKNVGSLTWKSGEIALAYKWYVNGRFYSNGLANIPIQADVKPNAVYPLNVALAPIDQQNNQIPLGDVIVEIDLIKIDEQVKLSSYGSKAVLLKSKISETTKSTNQPTIITINTPAMIALDSEYKILMDISNQTNIKWDPSDTYIEAQLVMLNSDDSIDISFKGPKSQLALTNESNPGIIARINGTLLFQESKSYTISPNKRYAINYTVCSGKKNRYVLGHYNVFIGNLDYNQRIIPSYIPTEINKNSKENANIIIRNAGSQSWDIKNTYLIGSWYDISGNPIKKNCTKVPVLIPKNKKTKKILPGATIEVEVPINNIPDTPGDYLLVWEIETNNILMNSSNIKRPGDILINNIKVN